MDVRQKYMKRTNSAINLGSAIPPKQMRLIASVGILIAVFALGLMSSQLFYPNPIIKPMVWKMLLLLSTFLVYLGTIFFRSHKAVEAPSNVPQSSFPIVPLWLTMIFLILIAFIQVWPE